MPTVKIALRKGVQVSQHIRAGVTVFAGEPQTFDVTDEQLVAILDDPAFDVDETTIDEETTKPKTKAEKLAAAKEEGLELDVTESNTVSEIDAAIEAARNAGGDDEETDEAIDETLDDEEPADDGDDANKALEPGEESSDDTTTDETAANASDSQGARVDSGDASAPASGSEESQSGDDFPTDVNAIKRLNRAVVVAKAQSLGIEANYDDKNGATKGELANLIVEKLKA